MQAHVRDAQPRAAGARIEWISAQLGHSSITTTLRFYARWLPAADARELGLLDSFADRGRVQDAHGLGVVGSDAE